MQLCKILCQSKVSVKWNVIWWSEEARKYFCPLWKWPLFESNCGVTRISENNTNMREMKWGKENDECTQKRLRYRKMFVREKWISNPLRCVHRGNFYWFSVRSDSSVVFHPYLYPHLLTLFFQTPTIFLFLLSPIRVGL